MITLSVRIVVALLCCLLTFTTSAVAECAWVLWVGGFARGSGAVWDIMGAQPEVKTCREQLLVLAATYRADGYHVNYGGEQTATYRKGEERGYLQCLPDTVDPREPKGK